MLTIKPENVSRSKKIALEIDRFAMLAGSVPSSESAGDVEALLSLSDHIREHLFDVLFIGGFKSGKSTLINTLAGKPLEPTKNTACTAVFTEIAFGESEGAVVYYKDGAMPREMPLEQFAKEFQYTDFEDDRDYDDRDYHKFDNVSHAEIHSSDIIFKDGIRLIDSPGLHEYAHNDRAFAEYVNRAQTIVFLLNANALFSANEKRYIAMNFAEKHMQNVFFLVNWVNLLPPGALEHMVIPAVRAGLKDVFTTSDGVFDETLYNSRVFYIDAYGALCASTGQPHGARQENEGSITREDTGIIPFESALSDFLNSEDSLNAAYRQVLDEMGRAYRGVTEFRLSALDKAEELKDELRRIFSHSGSLIAEELYGETRRFVSAELPERFTQKLNTLSEEEIRKINRGSVKHQTLLSVFPMLLAPPISDTAKEFIADFIDSQTKEWFEGIPAKLKLKEVIESSDNDAKRLCAAFDGIVNDAVRTISPEWTNVDLYMRTVMDIPIYTRVRPVTIADALSKMGKLAAAGLRVQLPRFSTGSRAILNNAGLTVFRDMEKELDAQRDNFIKTVMDEFEQRDRRLTETADRVLDEARGAIRKALDKGMGERIRDVYEELSGHRPDQAEFARFAGEK